MAFSRFQIGAVLRIVALLATFGALTLIVSYTTWYVTATLVTAIAIIEVAALLRFISYAGREVARFLDAVAFDDTAATFSALSHDGAFCELGAAMTRVLEQLRHGRAEREEQAKYLETLVAHIPVALISIEDGGRVQLLNLAARRLFEGPCTEAAHIARYGTEFVAGIEAVRPGESTILKIERPSGDLHLKAAATGITIAGVRRRLISLQNIEAELTAQELAAWQTVIRVMAHEVTNSLTPISSLAATAHGLVTEVLASLPAEDQRRSTLSDAGEALETMNRRSEGLLHFVQSHRRLTRRLVAKVELVALRRVFARLQRLLATELASRQIELVLSVVPESLELAADIELLDQALINLMRNAIEALRDAPSGRITLSALSEPSGRTVISVSDNGPGIAADQREKVFVPFFTTKRQGSGVGLTLVRQIATVHGAAVSIADAPGGGAVISLRF